MGSAMANRHFGNLADVFKHVALGEALAVLRPGEYWESHAGAAFYREGAGAPPERAHGVHTFARLAAGNLGLRQSHYYKVLAGGLGGNPPVIPGSPRIACALMGQNVRRMLFCDVEAESLQTIVSPENKVAGGVPREKIECVQDDGVTVLRGAGMLLPEQWLGSTLAFLDPYEMAEQTDAGISPLELFCELGGRGIVTLLFYGFESDGERVKKHEQMGAALEKARLLGHGTRRFEGSLKMAPAAGGEKLTQWGFGMLVARGRLEMFEAMDRQLKALETAYQGTELSAGVSGEWRYVSAGI